MQRIRSLIVILLLTAAFSCSAGSGKVIKVLPHFLDLKGRCALSPSLYDRDSYQAQLRIHPEERSALRFDIQWKGKKADGKTYKLRAELRGDVHDKRPTQVTLEQEVKPGMFSRWTPITIAGDEYKKFGELTAWRVTLWDGDTLVGEQKSFLW